MDVDLCLKYSCEEFEQELINGVQVKDIEPGDGILDLEPYPSLDIIVNFAQIVYNIDNNSQFGDGRPLPGDWRLLTTAQSMDPTNGYFGALFYSPSLHQVVLSHRGTDSVGAVTADVIGVILNKFSPHMNSALSFAFKVMSVLRQMNREMESCFQLSVTGHSLGGWLAQITVFALKYLQITEGKFTKIERIQGGHHVRAVVFESPGCRSMLWKIRDLFEMRYDTRTMVLNRLDISCYFSAVNRVNSYSAHLGTLYRVITGHENDSWYIKSTHSIDNMVDALKKPSTIVQMLDWPCTDISGGSEYDVHFEVANPENQYHPQVSAPAGQQLIDRYHFKDIPQDRCSLRVFSEDELAFLQSLIELGKSGIRLTKINEFADQYKFKDFDRVFNNFTIENECQEITSQTLQELIRQTKNLMRWIPEETMAALRDQMKEVPSAMEAMYRNEGENYLRRELPALPQSLTVNFRDDPVKLEDFLKSPSNILYIETPHTKMEMVRIVNIFKKIKESESDSDTELEGVRRYTGDMRSTFLDSRGLECLESLADLEKIDGSAFKPDNLLVVECTSENLDIISKIFHKLKNNSGKKLIFIDSCKTDFENIFNIFNLSEGNKLTLDKIITTDINLSHLDDESMKKFYKEKMFVLRGERWSLEDLVGPHGELTGPQREEVSLLIGTPLMKTLLTHQSFPIEIEEQPQIKDLRVCSTINEPVHLAAVVTFFGEASTRLVMSGISREELNNERWSDLTRAAGGRITPAATAEDGEAFFEDMCRREKDVAVYWIHVVGEELICKKILKKTFYMDREFNNLVEFDFGKFLLHSHEIQDIFIFQNISQQYSLSKLIESVGGNKKAFNETNIKTVDTEEQALEIMKKISKKSVHVLLRKEETETRLVWLRSQGSLDGLRPYVFTNTANSVDERQMCNNGHRVVIIADEPGMGKSTTLANVPRHLKSDWVINIDLKRFQMDGKTNSDLTVSSVTDFLLNGTKSSLLRGLLQICLNKEYKHSKQVYVLCDGFDEVKEDCASRDTEAKDEVSRLLKFIKNETTANMWLTTRLYTKDRIENDLFVFATVFQKLNEEKRREYLTMHWRSHLALELLEDRDGKERRLDKCAEHFYKQAKQVLGTEIDVFMGIPLQMSMLAEIFLERVKYSVANMDTEIRQSFEIEGAFSLFQKFKNLKYHIYLYDKTGLSAGMSPVIKQWIDTGITERHRILGLQTLFPEIGKEHFSDISDEWKVELNRVGLVQSGRNGNVEFTHRTLAEFFCADLTVYWLNQEDRYHGNAPLEELLLFKILLRDRNQFIRLFVNDFLRLNTLSDGARRSNAAKIRKLWDTQQDKLFDEQQQTALHVACDEGNDQIVGLLIDGLKWFPADASLLAFLVAQDKYGDTALSLAARRVDKETSNKKGKIYYGIMVKIIQILKNCSPLFKFEVILVTFMKGSFERFKVLEEYLTDDASVSHETKVAFVRAKKLIDEDFAAFLAAVRDCQGDIEELYSKMENDIERRYILLAHDRVGDTALHLISQEDNIINSGIREKILHYVRTLKIPVNRMSHNKNGDTPLHCAAAAGLVDTVRQLVELGAGVDCVNRHGQTALSSAALDGDERMVAFLLDIGANVNSVDDMGLTALFHAIIMDNRGVIKLLVGRGVDIDYANLKDCNALSYAARGGYLWTMKLLVEKGADIERADQKGWTALIHAARGGFLSVVTYLIERKANINYRDHEGSTALSHAALGGHFSVVEYLVRKGADINNADEMGWTALSHAALLGIITTVEFLIKLKSDVDHKNKKGLTALSQAALGGNESMVEVLMKHGADINIADDDGLTALSCAAREGRLSVVEMLLENGADVNSADKSGLTALSHATRGGHSAVVEALLKKGAVDPA